MSLAFARLLSAQPDPAWADSFQKAVSEFRGGQGAAGMRDLEALGKSYPHDAQLAAAIGALLDSTAHHKEATPWYQRSLALHPGFEPAVNNLAMNYASLGEFSKAQPLMMQASKLNPANASLAYNLGLVSLRLNCYKEAAAAFQRARRNTRDAASLDRLALAEATARFHLREYAEAASLLETLKAEPDYQTLLLLGSAQALSASLPDGIKTMQKAVAMAPADPQVYYRLALVFLLGRLNNEAQNVLSEGLKQLPGSALLLYGKAVASDTQGRWDDAISWAKKSLDADSRPPETWALLASVYAKQTQTDDALAAYRRALSLGAGAGAGVDLAQLLIRQQQFPEALAELNELAKKYPNDARVDRGFGKLYREQRQFDLAEKYLRASLRLDPEDSQARFTLVEVLRLTHRTDEARKEFAIFNEQKQEREATRLLELASNEEVK
jgi:tetratricopeptide (TPR) repeat protein